MIKRNLARQSFILLALSMLIASPGNAESASHSAESMVIPKFGNADGTTMLQSMIEKFKGMRDYWYESTLTTYPKQKPVTEKGRFYFKTPNLIRFEALAAGSRTGSVVVRQPNGKIRAKAGGLMGGITISLSPSSKLLQTPNGYSIVESDLATLLEGVLKASGGAKILATPSPCSYPGTPGAFIVEQLGADNLVAQRLIVDKESRLPVDWIIFQKDKLDSLVHVEKMMVNANIADSLFFLGRETVIANADTKTLGGASILSDSLKRKLEKIDASTPLNQQLIADIKSITKLLRTECTQLKNEFSSDTPQQFIASADASNPSEQMPSSTNWKTPVLLIRTSAIESYAISLRDVTVAIKTFDATTGKDIGSEAISNQWKKSLLEIDDSVANLYAGLDKPQPDSKSIFESVDKITTEANRLDVLLNWLSQLGS